MTDKITRQLAYGNETKTMELSMAPGAGGAWHVLIDRYYKGQVLWVDGKWKAYVSEDLDTMDVALVEEMITEVMPKGPFA